MTTLGQWKMGGNNPPIIKLVHIGQGEAYRNGDRTHDVVVQLDDAKEGLEWAGSRNWGIVCRLFSISKAKSKWTDIVINTNFGSNNRGYLRIWIDGEQRCDYSGPLVIIKDKSLYPGPNHRRGIYVGFTKRWDKVQPRKKKPTMIVYYDEFRVSGVLLAPNL